ncbi:hypothetical protein MYU51_021141 [Penicillium brevicompactum]
MATPSELLRKSLNKFNEIISTGALALHEGEVPLEQWRNQLGRIRSWAEKTETSRADQSFLDYRQRDASRHGNPTVKLLERLQELLSDLSEVLREESLGESSQDKKYELYGQVADKLEETTEIQQIYYLLAETISYFTQS